MRFGCSAWLKRWSEVLVYRMLARITDVNVPRDAGDFRPMSRRIVEALPAAPAAMAED